MKSRDGSASLRAQQAAAQRMAETRQRSDRPSQRRSQPEQGGRAFTRASLTGVKIRQKDAAKDLIFEGHASVTERAYEMWDFFGPYSEVVSAGAFDDTLARNGLDVPLVLGHDQMRRIARTTTGTLELLMDDEGLGVRAVLDPEDHDVQYVVPKLRSGLIDEMSFAFRIDSGVWSPDYSEYRIDKVDIHRGDVAIVGYGANPYTGGGMRADGGTGRSERARALLALELAV